MLQLDGYPVHMKTRRPKSLVNRNAAWLAVLLFSTLTATAWAESPYRVQTPSPVVIIGDVHGAFDALVSVLRTAGLVDESLSWTGADTHLVSVGDVIDRGDKSREAMDLLMRLQDEASAAGGAVHVILGNHEALNLSRDLRYLTPTELAAFAEFDPSGSSNPVLGHRAAFGSDGRYGRWLLELPLALIVNRTLIVHAGVSEDLLSLSLEEVNAKGLAQLKHVVEAMETLVAEGHARPEDEYRAVRQAGKTIAAGDSPLKAMATKLVDNLNNGLAFSPDGPLWYRGSAMCHPFTESSVVDAALAHFDVDRILIGHTPTRDGRLHQRLDGKVIRVDTGMNTAYYGGAPTAVRIVDGSLEAIYVESGAGFVTESARVWKRPGGMNDEEIEAFLRTAEVVKTEDLAEGVTKPKRLTLTAGDQTLRAVFKTFDSDPGLERGRWGRLGDKADRYHFDVAAYYLDRLLGLEMVPPAVLREVDGTPGTVQLWMENAVNEKARQERQLQLSPVCDLSDQYNLMNVFDALIVNEDRNLSNVLYVQPTWKVWLIDHTRAFRSDTKLPKMDRRNSVTVTNAMAKALANLSDEALDEALSPYLHSRQLKGIKARRDRLIKLAR